MICNTWNNFETLPNLPLAISFPQCVSWKEEILICAGWNKNECYSYHTRTNQYRLICMYPQPLSLFQGHAVVKCDRSDGITKEINNTVKERNGNDVLLLLSFAGYYREERGHTLLMYYQSVWDEENEIKMKEESMVTNQWIPIKDGLSDQNHLMNRIRILIGGSQNQLLFMVYQPNHIDVCRFDWKSQSFLCVARGNFPIPIEESYGIVGGCCFIIIDKQTSQKTISTTTTTTTTTMMMMNMNQAFFIHYDEQTKNFEYEKFQLCSNLNEMRDYAFIFVQDFIIIFGGFNHTYKNISDKIYLYSLKSKQWIESTNKLPAPIFGSVAIVEDVHKAWVHIIGGWDKEQCRSQHFRIPIRELIGYTLEEIKMITNYWIKTNNITRLGWIIEFSIIIVQYLGINPDLRNKRLLML